MNLTMKNRSFILLIFICLVQILLGVYFGSQKINFHVDEIATYGLANDEKGGWLTVPHARQFSGDQLREFVSASNSQFQYSNVWLNQSNDVHPPFYYIFIHTLSSFFPQQFAVNQGIGFNIVLSVIITILLYAAGISLLKKEGSALLLSAAWAISFGNMNQIVFLRMYMLLAVMIFSILLLHLYYYDRRHDIKFRVLLIVISILGALTHYYYIVFLFFLALVFGINLLWSKAWKEAAQYIVSLAIAGLLSILIFPSMLMHIFSGYRGVESFQNIFHISDILGRLKSFFQMISKQLFAGLLPALLVLLFVVLIVHAYKQHGVGELKRFLFESKKISRIGIAILACLGYYIIISKGAVMLFDRYIMPVYPIILLISFVIIAYLQELFPRFKSYAGYSVIIILTILGLFTQKMDYLYEDSVTKLEYAQTHAMQPVIVVCTLDSRMYTIYPELMNYDNLVVITPDEVNLLKQQGLNQYNEVIIYELVSQVDDSIPIDISQIIRDNSELSTSKEVYKQYNETTYITTTVYELK